MHAVHAGAAAALLGLRDPGGGLGIGDPAASGIDGEHDKDGGFGGYGRFSDVVAETARGESGG